MRRLALLTLIVFILFADQVTKHIARDSLIHKVPRRYGVVTLLYAENRGAFLNLGANLPRPVRTTLFDGMVGVGLIVGIAVLFGGVLKTASDAIAIAMIIAGGIGNLIDRVRFRGRVTDFLYISIGPLHTGVFNIADMAITFGVLWLIVSWGFTGRGRRPSRRADSPSSPKR